MVQHRSLTRSILLASLCLLAEPAGSGRVVWDLMETAGLCAPDRAASRRVSTALLLAADGESGPLPLANPGDQVLVKRTAVKAIPPEKYRANLYLEPYYSLVLSAPQDAVVREIPAKINAKLAAQAPAVQLDHGVTKLQLAKAQAEYRAMTIEQKLVDTANENAVALAQARLDAAKASLDLAQLLDDQMTVRAPQSVTVLEVLVVPGQFVRAGDPLLRVGDLSKLKVNLPVERKQVEPNGTFSVKVEAESVSAKVEAVQALSPRFDPLRDLFESVASAIIVIDNPNGTYQPGQTVYSPVIPRQFIADVPSSAIQNGVDGARKVQVLRQSVVRDLAVELLGPVGTERLFVSGAFADGDEVIYETSHQLPDGFTLKSAAAAEGGKTVPGAAPSGTPVPTRPSQAGAF
jgi:multidrug efflux pump subunit AcrA (membrane-fusion protein)